MAEGENQGSEGTEEEWHPKTRKDYEDLFAGGIIRAAELEEAEKARKASEGNEGNGSSGSSDGNDTPPRGAKPARSRRNFLG